jgi:acetyl-CoA carboxylase carboxyl transferase alpha subunit
MSEGDALNIADEIARLTDKADKQLRATYAKLTAWQKTQVARHPQRPKANDYLRALIADYTPLAGDRAYGDDAAIVGGLGRFRGRSVVVLGTEKGADTEERVRHNFGMAKPEGYRKARRLMELAGRFGLPILTFVDTSGAFPGIEAEARGQYEILAKKAEGLQRIVEGCGGAQQAFQLLLLEHLPQMAETAAKAIANVKFDKVVVWDAGAGTGGKNATASFLHGLAGSLPPMLQMMKDIGGVEMPAYFGKLAEMQTPGAQPAGPAAPAAPTAASPKAASVPPPKG